MATNRSKMDVPERLRRYILTSVPSVPFVEAMLIFRAKPAMPHTIDDVARNLYIGGQQAAQILEQLRAAHIIEPVDGGHRYSPPPDLVPVLDELAAYYGSNLVEVTSLIHTHVGRMAQQFADAFKLRKD